MEGHGQAQHYRVGQDERVPFVILQKGEGIYYIVVTDPQLKDMPPYEALQLLKDLEDEHSFLATTQRVFKDTTIQIDGRWLNEKPEGLTINTGYSTQMTIDNELCTITLGTIPKTKEQKREPIVHPDLLGTCMYKPLLTKNQTLFDRILHGKKNFITQKGLVTAENNYYELDKRIMNVHRNEWPIRWRLDGNNMLWAYHAKTVCKSHTPHCCGMRINNIIEEKIEAIKKKNSANEVEYTQKTINIEKKGNPDTIDGTAHIVTGYKRTYTERNTLLTSLGLGILIVGIGAFLKHQKNTDKSIMPK